MGHFSILPIFQTDNKRSLTSSNEVVQILTEVVLCNALAAPCDHPDEGW